MGHSTCYIHLSRAKMLIKARNLKCTEATLEKYLYGARIPWSKVKAAEERDDGAVILLFSDYPHEFATFEGK